MKRDSKKSPSHNGSKKSKRKVNNPSAYKLFVADFHKKRKAMGQNLAFKEPGSSMRAAAAAWAELTSEEKKVYEMQKRELSKIALERKEAEVRELERQAAMRGKEADNVSIIDVDDSVHHNERKQSATVTVTPMKKEKDDGKNGDSNNPSGRPPQVIFTSGSPQATDTNTEHSVPTLASLTGAKTGAMSEVELGPLYGDIKRKLAGAKSKDEKKFYGHLKRYFVRKIRIGSLLSRSEFKAVTSYVARFESNVKLLDEEENDYDDICVYSGFIKHITDECQKELVIADLV